MQEKTIILNKTQKQALSTLSWLFSPETRFGDEDSIGRSTVMAYAFLRAAISNPGRKIKIFDHKNTEKMNKEMIQLIKGLAKGNRKLLNSMLFTPSTLVIDKSYFE